MVRKSTGLKTSTSKAFNNQENTKEIRDIRTPGSTTHFGYLR